MVLNSLQIDPNKTWKGIWRWYSEEVLHCTTHEAMQNGMSLEQLTQLARCNGLHTMTFRPNESNPYAHRTLSSTVIAHQHSQPLYATQDTCCSNDHTATSENNLTHDTEAKIQPESMPFGIHHNTSAAYMHAFDFDLFETALIATC